MALEAARSLSWRTAHTVDAQAPCPRLGPAAFPNGEHRLRPGSRCDRGALGGEFRGDRAADPAQGGMAMLHGVPQRGAGVARRMPAVVGHLDRLGHALGTAA